MMKRIKSEQINSIVCQYLTRRRIFDGSDSSQRRDCRDQGVSDMALAHLVQARSSNVYGFTYSSISVDTHQYGQQFNRLKAFVQDASSIYKEELESVLFPVFVHFYLQMLSNGHKSAAHKFHSRHNSGFVKEGVQRGVTEALVGLYSDHDVRQSKQAIRFLENKYCVTLSEDSLQYLLRFLKRDDCTLLLQVFNCHIQVEIKASSENEEVFQQGPCRGSLEPVPPASASENRVAAGHVTMTSLRDSISSVRKGCPGLPSVAFYTFLNAYQGLCTAAFSHNDAMLSGGFEDSSIRVWNLQSYSQSKDSGASRGRGLDQSQSSAASCERTENDPYCSNESNERQNINISHVHLAGDYLDDVHSRNRAESRGEDGCRVLRAHSGSVYSVSFTPDNQHLLSSSEDTTVRLWDLDSCRNLAIYRGHSYPVWCVQSSPAGGYLASCGRERCARVWCLERVHPLRTLAGHSADVDVLRFHPNGSYLATGSSDHTVRLWSVADGKCMRLLHGHRGPVFALAFSPDGKLLASAGEDKRVRVWDLGAGTVLHDFKAHTDIVYSLCFNKHSSLLFSGGMDCMIRCWDVRNAHTSQPAQATCAELLASFPTKSACIHTISFTNNNFLMAAGVVT